MNAIKQSTAKRTKTRSGPTVSDLCRSGLEAIEALQKLALTGDDKAARGLWSLASLSNSYLAPLLRAPGPVLRAAMEAAPACPANLPANLKRREELAAELLRLGLAKNCQINARGKFSREAPMSKAVAVAWFVCWRLRRKHLPKIEFPAGWDEWAQENKSKLPQRLTHENARDWADLTEPLLKIFWGERFEEHPDFANYGEKQGARARGAITPGKRQSELCKQWRQSWNSLASPVG